MKPKKKPTMNAVGNHALRRGSNLSRHDRNVERLDEAGIPYGSGQMRPSRVVRLAERAYARNEAAKQAAVDAARMEEVLARIEYGLGVTVDGEDIDA